jgi:hypothetical protein
VSLQIRDFRCPRCRRVDSIDILAAIWVRLTHDGTDPDLAHNGDHEWSDDSTAFCAHCKYTGAVSQFDIPSTREPTAKAKGGAA